MVISVYIIPATRRGYAEANRYTSHYKFLFLSKCLLHQTAIILDTTHGDSIVGQAVGAEGKRTKVQIVRGHLHGDVETVRVVGREELTNAEQAREEFLLLLLRGEASLDQSLFIRILWFPSTFASTISARGAYYQSTSFSHFNLNPSQEKVANAMVSDPGALVIAHGNNLQRYCHIDS